MRWLLLGLCVLVGAWFAWAQTIHKETVVWDFVNGLKSRGVWVDPTGGGGGGTTLTVTEVDGVPSGTFSTLKFSNGSVTDNGDDSATITTGVGGGGDFSSNTSTSLDGEAVLFSGPGGKTGKRSTLTATVVKSANGIQTAAVAGTDYVIPGGTVATATALASNGANCATGQAAIGVNEAGNAEGCFDVATQPELDTHAALTNPHSATALNTANRLVLRDASGNFSAGTITAALSGTAATATALATNGTNCPLGQAARGIDATGAAEECTPVPSGAAIFATEIDGSPTGSFTTLKFSNGSLTDNGDGSATVVTGAGGGGDFSSNTTTSVDNEVVLFSGAGGKTGKRSTLTAAVVKSLSGVQVAAVPGTDYVAPGGTAATATALAANGANCSAGQAPLGINDLGAVEGCFDVATQTELDAHEAVTSPHSATALNTPSRIVLRDGSGNFAAGTVTAALTGNASTATALAANGTNCPAGQAAQGVDASGNAEGCAASGGGGGVADLAPVPNQFVTGLATGTLLTAQPSVANLSDGAGLVRTTTPQIVEDKQIVPRVCEFPASSGTLAPNLDLCDKAYRHDVSGPVAVDPPTATGSNPRPMHGLTLSFRAATEQPITWAPIYGDGYGIPLPSAIPSSRYMALLFLWNVTSGKYELWAGDVTLAEAVAASSAASRLYLHAVMGVVMAVLLALLVFLWVPALALAQDITSNLTMHLKFDEGTGTTAQDTTVNNHDGTLTTGVTWGSPKLGTNAVVYNGTTAAKVNVTGLLGSPSAVTLAAWVKPSSFPGGSQSDAISLGSYMVIRIGSTQTLGSYDTGAGYSNTTAAVGISTTAWTHVAYTVTAGAQRLYINGSQVASASNAAAPVYTGRAGNTTIIGGHGEASVTFRYAGTIDDARVYSRVLTAPDIAALATWREPAATVVQITTPTTDPTLATSTATLTTLGGTAADTAGVTSVTWACPTCTPASGTATCSPACSATTFSTNWTVPSLTLAEGSNVITVTAHLGAVVVFTDTLTITLSTVVPPDITTALEMHLAFDEGTGTVAQDSTTHNHDGTLGSGATWGSGRVGAGAIALDGTTLGTVTVVGELTQPSAVTLAAWVWPTAFPTTTADVLTIGNQVALRVSASEVRGLYWTGSTWLPLFVSHALSTTGWTHLAYTATTGSQHLYINGTDVATGTQAAAISYVGAGTDTYLGRLGVAGTTQRFQGLIDDARVYTRVLAPIDVNALATLAAPGAVTVQILTPTAEPTWHTASATVTDLGGNASDNVGVTSITWSCPTCTPTSGTATCSPACGAATTSTAWSIASLTLALGNNLFTVTANDAAGTATDSLTLTYTPPSTPGVCTHWASQAGGGSGLAQGAPMTIAAWLALPPTAGQTLCLLDGNYLGVASVITPPAGLSGTAGFPLTVQALNDGAVLLDGENVRNPVVLAATNQYWVIRGLNARNGLTSVFQFLGSNNRGTRLVGWDATLGQSNATIFSVVASNSVFEDCAGFGLARVIFQGSGTVSAPGSGYRRCWGEWSSHPGGGALGGACVQPGKDQFIENLICTVDALGE